MIWAFAAACAYAVGWIGVGGVFAWITGDWKDFFRLGWQWPRILFTKGVIG